MAAAAETIQNYIPADTLPGIAEARQEIRNDAWALVASRRKQMQCGDIADLPLMIDALSTADYAVQTAEMYGEQSTEHQEAFSGLVLDCRRLVAEWYRKLKPEYFPSSRHFFDAETGDFFSHGLSIRQMTENALRPINNDPEEEARRVNERVENETPHLVKKLGSFALGQVGIRTISECTDKAIQDFAKDQRLQRPHSGYNGYVPEIEKVMIRDIRLDETSGDRFEEQIGLPGIYITHDVIQRALRRRGVDATQMDKTALHGNQLIVQDDLIDFVELLDTVASEEWCVSVFMGEKVDPAYQKNYSQIRQEAQERQEGLNDLAENVARFTMDLAADGFDRRKAPAYVEEFVKKLLIDISMENTELAKQIFNKETAQGLTEVKYLESIGRNDLAFERLLEVEKAAPGGGFCGAGSCGLERVKPTGADSADVKKLGFDPKDTLLDKGGRKCPNCRSEKVVYDTKQGKKGCTGCGITKKY